MPIKPILLSELTYTPNLNNGEQAFWDFYAMYMLWWRVGSGYKEYYGSDHFPEEPVATQQRKDTVDKAMEQICRPLGFALVRYIKKVSIREFRYVLAQSKFFTFKLAIDRAAGSSGKSDVTVDEFNDSLKEHLPHVDVDLVEKLLKFDAAYNTHGFPPYMRAKSAIDTILGVSPDDEVVDNDDIPYDPTPTPSLDDEEEPVNVPVDDEDDSDIEDPPEQEPGEKSWTDKWIDKKLGLDEVKYNVGAGGGANTPAPGLIKNIANAMTKAGLTIKDVAVSFNMIEWGSQHGGSAWGEGLDSALKLEKQLKKMSIKDLVGFIDHIYDLEHNTGSLLNKGTLNVSKNALDSRAKIKSIGRFISRVSPIVARLIKNNLEYFNTSVEKEKELDDLKKSTGIKATKEESGELMKLGFLYNSSWGKYVANTKIWRKSKHKQGYPHYEEAPSLKSLEENSTRELWVTKFENSGFLLSDSLDSELKIYKDFDSLQQALLEKSPLIRQLSPYDILNSEMAERDEYIKSATKYMFSSDNPKFETLIKLGVVPNYNNKYYSLDGGSLVLLNIYSIGDDKFLLTNKVNAEIETITGFDNLVKKIEGVAINHTGKPDGLYTKKKSPVDSGIPANPTIYNNIGVGNPNQTIRLKKEDEEFVGKFGFKPRMIKNKKTSNMQIVYQHDGTRELMYFFHTNNAYLRMPLASAGVKFNSIQEAINYIMGKYKSGQTISPLSISKKSLSTAVGSPNKVGNTFGSIAKDVITKSGFVWDNINQRYENKLGDTIEDKGKYITVSDALGNKKTYVLLSLLQYLKGKYLNESSYKSFMSALLQE